MRWGPCPPGPWSPSEPHPSGSGYSELCGTCRSFSADESDNPDCTHLPCTKCDQQLWNRYIFYHHNAAVVTYDNSFWTTLQCELPHQIYPEIICGNQTWGFRVWSSYFVPFYYPHTWIFFQPQALFLKQNTLFTLVKGIVHPKMKILSSFTHPQVVPNLYECLCSAEHKGRYSEQCGKQSSSGAPLTSIVFFFLLWKSKVPQNSLVTNFLQNIFLFARQNKDIHKGLELLEGE